LWGGVISLTKSLAEELDRDGMALNFVALGFVERAH
jgi:NAD(P)-dependent dehydrogenase (short-subunit alcohol dehydrogenase family)